MFKQQGCKIKPFRRAIYTTSKDMLENKSDGYHEEMNVWL